MSLMMMKGAVGARRACREAKKACMRLCDWSPNKKGGVTTLNAIEYMYMYMYICIYRCARGCEPCIVLLDG
jgi:hypothetical protein